MCTMLYLCFCIYNSIILSNNEILNDPIVTFIKI